MKKVIISLLAIVAITVSCTKSIENPEENLVSVTMGATLEPTTKATLNDLAVEWQDGDKIAVWDGVAIRQFSLVSKSGSTGHFVGEVSATAEEFFAIYPYSAASDVSGNVATLTLPTIQNLGSDCVCPDALVCVAKNTSIKNMSFKNVVSLVKFKVGADNLTEVSFRDNGYFPIAGEFTYNFASELVATTDNSASSVKAVASSVLAADQEYYLTILPTECTNGFTVACGNETEVCHKKTFKSASFVRNGGLNLKTVDGEKMCKKEITTCSELVDWMAEAKKYGKDETVTFGSDIDVNQTLVSIDTLECTLDGGNYSLQNWTSDGVPFILCNKGTVENIMIDEYCTLNWPAVVTTENFAFLVAENYGTVKNCTNSANIESNTQYNDLAIGHIYNGILVGNSQSGSKISGCYNYGALNLTVTNDNIPTNTLYISTICGRSIGNGTEISDCYNSGAVSFNFASNQSGSGAQNPLYIAGIAGSTNDRAKMSRCTNEAPVTASFVNNYKAMCLAGVVAYSAGEVTDCSNTGNVTYASQGVIKGTAVGGIAAYQGRKISGCTNSGDISVTAKTFKGRNKIGSLDGTNTKSTGSIGIGGIVGYSYGGTNSAAPVFSMTSCNNNGKKITLLISQAETCAYAGSGRFEVGGVIGDAMGDITTSNNKADISVTIKPTAGDQPFTPKASSGSVTAAQICVAGISGGDYMGLNNKYSSIISCNNSGNVTVTQWASHASNSYAGGIVAWQGSEDLDNPTKLSGCTNSGDVTVNGQCQFRIGGVSASSGNKENCTNTGKVTSNVKGGNYTYDDGSKTITIIPQVGGLVGFQKGMSLKNCKNTGDVVCSDANNAVGGFIGRINDSAFDAFSGCVINCTVSVPTGATRYGILNGEYKNNTVDLTVGDSSSKIKIKGAVKLGSSTTTLTSSNFMSEGVAKAYNYNESVHTVNATYGE